MMLKYEENILLIALGSIVCFGLRDIDVSGKAGRTHLERRASTI